MLPLLFLVFISFGFSLDNQERWLYEKRPIESGYYSGNIFMDSRLGQGCFQKHFAPNKKSGLMTSSFRSVPCPSHLGAKPLPCGKPKTNCNSKLQRSTIDELFFTKPYQIFKSMTNGTYELIHNKKSKD